MKKNIKILITGPVPPPAGGISVHIQRLQHLLSEFFILDLIDESGEKKNGIFNMRSLNVPVYLKKVMTTKVLFIHSGNKVFKKIHIVTGKLFGKKVIITLHGYGAKRKQPFKAIDSFVFNLADKIILVNAHIEQRLSLKKEKIVVKHAFLPPVMENEPPLIAEISDWLTKKHGEGKALICANASRLDMFNNEDLYGLDLCISAINRLVTKKHKVALVFTVSSLDNGTEYFNKNKDLIRRLGLEENILLINERLSFVRLIEKCDIVLRPTNTDGDALTVREALHLGKQAVASDVIQRPEGTVLFRNRDVESLEQVLEQTIKKISSLQEPVAAGTKQEDLKSFYVDLINEVVLK